MDHHCQHSTLSQPNEMEYHTFVFIDYHSNGILVPQQVYKPSAAPYPLLENITFRQGQVLGVSLHRVLNGGQNIVSDGHTRPPTTQTSTKIKIRILWPGYSEFWKDINAKEHTKSGDPIPKSKLALCVAQVVQAFYEQNARNACKDANWAVQRIRFEDLRLLELRQVSTGSWQPVLVWEHRQ